MSIVQFIFVLTMILFVPGTVIAQVPDKGHADPYAHDKYITGTGATVANPGRSQSGGTTSLDRGIQQQDDAIDKGICKGC